MTISEAIIGSIYPYAVDEALIGKTCIDLGINMDDEYSATDREKVARATIFILQNMLSLSSEGKSGDSSSYDTNKLKERIYNIASFNGLTDIAEEYKPHSRIIDRSDMW